MKNIGIAKPCNENWNNMDKNATGAFCQSCSKNVIDFTSMSGPEIRNTLAQAGGGETCGRIRPIQLAALNADFESWQMRDKQSFQRAFVFALLVAFGFSLFSCADEKQKQEIRQIRRELTAIVNKPQAPDSLVVLPAPQGTEVELIGMMMAPEVVAVEEILPEPEEPVSPFESYEELIYLGGVGLSYDYERYLEELPAAPIDEYDENGMLLPKEFAALAYPNPTADVTTLELKLPSADQFTILLLDMNGKTLSTLHSGEILRGTFSLRTDLSEYPAGTYMIAVYAKSFKEVLKVMRL